ncbi:hypothetical protein ACIHCM_08610 [Streptomyces sp. NPDC052023]|uniref:hypothetical protein n=1 Tax=Streptomyces sp. NPDC052023 TaxID=3365681 RepID=UPI0037D3F8AB
MGVYLVDVGAREWFGEERGGDGEERGPGEVASALNAELSRRGLPPFEPPGFGRGPAVGAAPAFEEKLVPPMDGFLALCRAHLREAETWTVCGWSVLLPVSLDREIVLPVASAYDVETTVAGAPQVLALARRLAAAAGLPDGIPATGRRLELTAWFLDGPARRAAAAEPGPWSADLDTTFYVALYLRAAEHALRHGRPIVYS